MSGLHDDLSLYEILDIYPDATPQEIRDAYFHAKSTYTSGNVALYTLISPDEQEDTIRAIENAYMILSSPEKRREYDSKYAIMTSTEVFSIDRVPPMEHSSEDILIPPALDFNINTKLEFDPANVTGAYLKKVRESLAISLEEMSSATKISKTYINALEEDQYKKLPAPVYVRGFVTQMAKILKLPYEKVAIGYMDRVKKSLA